jgi:AcrR family transcriptional regulator
MPNKQRPATPLSREAILEAAIELADQGGLEAVSMRAIATRFGVTAMSLYNHVDGKDGIVDGMIDQVIAEIDLPELTDWKEVIRRIAVSTREVLVEHPWAPTLWLSRQSAGPARLRWGDRLLRALRRGDLDDETVFHTYHILESNILGSTLQQLSFPFSGDELTDLANDFLETFPRDEYPDFVTHIEAHLMPRKKRQTDFEFSLDLILDGLERSRTA